MSEVQFIFTFYFQNIKIFSLRIEENIFIKKGEVSHIPRFELKIQNIPSINIRNIF
jgi:hypothetical protein